MQSCRRPNDLRCISGVVQCVCTTSEESEYIVVESFYKEFFKKKIFFQMMDVLYTNILIFNKILRCNTIEIQYFVINLSPCPCKEAYCTP